MTNVIIKHWRMVALGLGTVLFIWIVYLMRTVVLPFAIGLILAYLLMPLVNWLENKLPPRHKWPNFRRIISVLIACLALLALVGGFVYFIVTAVIDASVILLQNAPALIGRSFYQIQLWLEGIVELLPVEIQEEFRNEVIQSGISLGDSIRSSLMAAITSLPGTFSVILGFAVLPFFLFYIMKDSERLKRGIGSVMTPNMAYHARNVVNIVESVLGQYIRAQLMLGLIVAYFSFIGLWLLNIPFSLALALLAGVTELIPTLGPWIGGAVAVIVTLATVPEKAIWVALLFVGVQLVENNLLVPKVQSAYLHIHPAVMIFILVMGAFFAGFWGLLLAGPLVATLFELVKYVRRYYESQKPGQAHYHSPP